MAPSSAPPTAALSASTANSPSRSRRSGQRSQSRHAWRTVGHRLPPTSPSIYANAARSSSPGPRPTSRPSNSRSCASKRRRCSNTPTPAQARGCGGRSSPPHPRHLTPGCLLHPRPRHGPRVRRLRGSPPFPRSPRTRTLWSSRRVGQRCLRRTAGRLRGVQSRQTAGVIRSPITSRRRQRPRGPPRGRPSSASTGARNRRQRGHAIPAGKMPCRHLTDPSTLVGHITEEVRISRPSLSTPLTVRSG